MQLRYSFRLYPNGPQRAALARAFGCARVVFNDALRARESAHENGRPYPKTAELSKLLITEAKGTPEREAGAVVGIDLGLTHFAVLSDGRKIDSPRFLRRAEKKLKKAQQSLSRKVKGSNNRDKQRVKVARAHARVADARREFHHQQSTALICENQAIAVETLSVRGLARTRMAKSVHDAGWSSFVDMLEYKAARYGRQLVRVGRFEPTSQVCSACGVKDGPKPLAVREWSCTQCGTAHDRDVNAAINIKKAAGLAVPACGAQVRPGAIPAQRREAGTHRDGRMAVAGILTL